MRQPWSKMNVDGADFRMTDRELDRVYDEMPSLPEPPALSDPGDAPGASRRPPRSQAQTIAPPAQKEEEPTECANPACATAFASAAESGQPLVDAQGNGCVDRRQVNDAAKRPNPDRRVQN